MAENKQPKVSVLITSYNYGRFLDLAIESVINQTYKNWNLIITDDGSSDNSLDIIKGYVKKYPGKIEMLTHEGGKNRGLAETYKLGIGKCSGEYIAFLESDDFLVPESLRVRVNELEKNKDAVLAYNDLQLTGNLWRKINIAKSLAVKKSLISEYLNQSSFYAFEEIYDNLIQTFSAVMIRRSAIEDIDFINRPQNCDLFSDCWLWFLLSLKGKFIYINQKLTTYRCHYQSLDGKTKSHVSASLIKSELKYSIEKEIFSKLQIKSDMSEKLLNYVLEKNGLERHEVKVKANHLNLLKATGIFLPFFAVRGLYRIVKSIFY